jgi:hypothetical protein
LRGLSVDGLKADLQERLRETVDNTATTTEVPTDENAGNAEMMQESPGLPSGCQQKTNDKDEEGINAGNAMKQHAESPGISSISDIAAALPTKKPNDKDEEGIIKSNDDKSSSSSSKKSSSSSSDTLSSNSRNNGITDDDNTVSTTNFPI